MEVKVFNRVKEQVHFLNDKTFGLENQVKFLEDKIRRSQNKINALQRELDKTRKDSPPGSSEFSARMDDAISSVDFLIKRTSLMEKVLGEVLEVEGLSDYLDEKLIAEQHDSDLRGYFRAMKEYYVGKVQNHETVECLPSTSDKMMWTLRKGMWELRNVLPDDLWYEISIIKKNPCFRIGHIRGEIREKDESLELILTNGKGKLPEIFEYYDATELIQDITKIFAEKACRLRKKIEMEAVQ